ncbi:MAG: hypothetical protein Fur006_63790 [Coleofasciculaceae cyanobacterium]
MPRFHFIQSRFHGFNTIEIRFPTYELASSIDCSFYHNHKYMLDLLNSLAYIEYKFQKKQLAIVFPCYLYYIGSNLREDLENLKKLLPDFEQDKKSIEKWFKKNGNYWVKQFRNTMIKYIDVQQLNYNDVRDGWSFTDEQHSLLWQYHDANQLLIDCLNSCKSVSLRMREEIENTLLLPVAKLKELKHEKS